MGYTTRTTKTGRTIVETDGRSNGALMQGVIIAKFSIPAGMSPEDAMGMLRANDCHRCPNAGPDYIDSIHDAVPGIRVFSWRMVK